MMRLLLFFCGLILALNLSARIRPIAQIQGQQDSSPLVGEEVMIKGIVTASKVGEGYFLQDADSAWSGIFIYDLNRSPMPSRGDEVLLTGKVKEYYNLTEIDAISTFDIISTENKLPEPILISASDNLEAYEGMLVQIMGGTCTSSDIGYGEWEINDGTGDLSVDEIFHSYSANEGDAYDITGVMHYTYSAYKIAPRDAKDIVINSPLYFTRKPYQVNLQKNELTLYWETNVEATTEVLYGTSPETFSDTISLDDNVTNHQLVINNLNPGELYYTKVFSVAGNDTTSPVLSAFTTVSNSSGDIKVCFTKPDNFKIGYTEADDLYYTKSIADTIASYINKAQNTLDIAIYDVKNHSPESNDTNRKIFDAIKAKADSGLQVRIITDNDSDDAFFTEMLGSAQVMWGNSDGIMHHKFIVVDAQSDQNSWVVTGSTNWTYNNLVLDANNFVAIQDQSLAKAYTAEFNEMWGGSQYEPDYGKSRFSAEKLDNTPHLFSINNKRVELYFSPSDNTEKRIIEAIESADYEIAFNIMAFTSNGIGTALIDAHNRGVSIKGVIDYVEYTGSEYEYLLDVGIDVVDYTNADGLSWPENTTVHHKFLVVDYAHPNSDPQVITGTHNWSASAESRNDENTLVIYDHHLAEIFYNEVEIVYANSIPTSLDIQLVNSFRIFPVPATDILNISGVEKIGTLTMYNIDGSVVVKHLNIANENIRINTSAFNSGIYIVRIVAEDRSVYQTKVIIK